MRRKYFTITLCSTFIILTSTFIALSGTGFTQDYIDPSQNEGGAEQKTNADKGGLKDIKLETDYEERLRKQIEQQLKDKEKQALGQDEDSEAEIADDTKAGEEDDAEEPIACGTTTASVVNAIVKNAATGKKDDPSVKRLAGLKLNESIRKISQEYSNLPSQTPCSIGSGTSVKNINDDVKKVFQKNLIAACQDLAKESKEAVKTNGIKGYSDYINSKLSEMSQISYSNAVIEKCASGDTIVEGVDTPGSGIVSGTGSGGGSGGGSNGGSQTASGSQNGPQSYPNGIDPDEASHGHNHNATASSPGPQSLQPPPESHSNDPPGMSFPAGARRLKMQLSSKVYANCVFHDGTSPVTACKKELDVVHKDMFVNQVSSMDMGMYHNIYDICKEIKDPACEEGGGGYAKMLKGFMTYGSQLKNAQARGSSLQPSGSCHPDSKASDVEFSKGKPDEAQRACCKLGPQRARCGSYHGFTEISSCTTRKPFIFKGDKAPICGR